MQHHTGDGDQETDELGEGRRLWLFYVGRGAEPGTKQCLVDCAVGMAFDTGKRALGKQGRDGSEKHEPRFQCALYEGSS